MAVRLIFKEDRMDSDSRKILGLVFLRIGARLGLIGTYTVSSERPDWVMLGVVIFADVLVEVGAYLFNPERRVAIPRRRKKEAGDESQS
jgi:hypothetical protein